MATANENEFDSSKLLELGILGGLGAYGANQTRKDANTQIQGLEASNNLFGPDSPYAQQLRQNLERRDAADGRRSQYGPREVELQAKLAEMNAGQASRNAPALNTLYQQRQGATITAGKDFANILVASGGLKKLSPMVQNLFKRRVLEDAADKSGTDTYGFGNDSFNPANTQLNSGVDTYGFGNDSFSSAYYDSYEPNFDFGSSGLDFGGYDSYASDFDAYSGGFDAATSGFDSAYEVDFGSLPGFAKGGPVNIFQALKKSANEKIDGGYKQIAPQSAPPQRQTAPQGVQQMFEGPNDRQEFGRGLSTANTASRLAGVKGGILGPAAMVPAIFTADNASDRTNAAANAAIYAVNPILGATLGVMRALHGNSTKYQDINPKRYNDGLGLTQEAQARGETQKTSTGIRDKTYSPFEDIWRAGGGELNDTALDDARSQGYEVVERNGNQYVSTTADQEAALADRAVSERNTAAGMVQGENGGWSTAFATGGPVRGPGTGTSDSIVARLSDGEYVNTAATVDSLGTSLFEKLEAKAKRSTPEELKKFKAGLQALF